MWARPREISKERLSTPGLATTESSLFDWKGKGKKSFPKGTLKVAVVKEDTLYPT